MKAHTLRHYRRETGQGLVEYSLILVLVALGSVVALVFFGQSIRSTYCDIMTGLAPVTTPPDNCGDSRVQPVVISEGPDFLNLEASIDDPEADPGDPYGRVERVDFYIDSLGSSPVQQEWHYRYCLSGNPGGMPCGNYDTSGLPPGEHLVTIKVNFDDGSVATTTYTYVK